jgi:hypothetical protein
MQTAPVDIHEEEVCAAEVTKHVASAHRLLTEIGQESSADRELSRTPGSHQKAGSGFEPPGGRNKSDALARPAVLFFTLGQSLGSRLPDSP